MVNFRFFVLVFLLTGCGGAEFDAFGAAPSTTDGRVVDPATDSGVGGAATASGGASMVGDDAGSGGAGGREATDSGGADTDGGDAASSGGASAGGSGGEFDSGSDPGSGGAGGNVACTPVTHSNGLGQTWKDCVSLGTYDQAQAMKACAASGAAHCQTIDVCGSSLPEVRGYSTDNSKIIGRWGYEGTLAGYVGTGTLGELCFGANDPNNRKWN